MESKTSEENSVESTQKVEAPTVLKPLSWLDKLLALWIFLAIVIGLLLAAFVPSARRVLEGQQFVNVSVPLTVRSPHH